MVVLRDDGQQGGWLSPFVSSTVTDRDGHFRFESVSPGTRYTIRAAAEGFFHSWELLWPPASEPTIQMREGETAISVSVALEPYRVISGKLLDVSGDPLYGFEVRAVPVDPSGSRRRGTSVRAWTDDRGMYRISDLAPGQYYILATPPNFSGRGKWHWQPTETGYSTEYHADESVVLKSRVIDLRIKLERDGVDFQVPRVPVYQRWRRASGKPATIEGKVTDTLHNEPLGHVLVSLRSIATAAAASTPEVYATETDAAGQFLIHAASGQYHLETYRSGFMAVGAGPDFYPKLILRGGEHVRTSVSMMPAGAGVISGRVVDEDRNPVRGASVALGHYQSGPIYSSGSAGPVFAPSATTDDHGEYRLPVRTGTYYPRAFPPDSNLPLAREMQRVRGFWFVPTYLAGTDFATGKAVVVSPGSDIRLPEIVLGTEHRFSIRGKFTEYESGRHYSVLLRDIPEHHEYESFHVGWPPPPKYSELETKISGQEFEIRDVPPGKYFVTAETSAERGSTKPLHARQAVEVVDHDVEDVVLNFAMPFNISARVVVEGPWFNLSGTMVALMWDWQDRHEVRLKSDGVFELTGFLPELYEFQWSYSRFAPSAYLKSVWLGTRQINDMRIDLRGGPQPLTLVYANDASSITGIVRDATRRPVSAAVVVIPENADTFTMLRPRVSYSSSEGVFTLLMVPPGAYRLLALDVMGNDMLPPEFWTPYLDESIRIIVAPSSSQSVELRAAALSSLPSR